MITGCTRWFHELLAAVLFGGGVLFAGLGPSMAAPAPSPQEDKEAVAKPIKAKKVVAPNKDLLRALHVVDSAAVDPGRLMLVNARVLHRSGQAASPIELEALRPDTAFQGTMKLDEALFSGWARQRGLHLRGENWLQDLPRIVQAHTAGRLAQEVAWFDGVRSAGQVYDFYKKLQRARLPGNAFLLQVGWGTGWDGKTLGSRLKTDPRFMDGILRSPRDGGFGLSRGRRQPGDPFPKTRRVAMQVHRSQDGRVEERPVSPLGWTLVELQEQ